MAEGRGGIKEGAKRRGEGRGTRDEGGKRPCTNTGRGVPPCQGGKVMPVLDPRPLAWAGMLGPYGAGTGTRDEG
jgi:hypothetical protein